MYRIPIVEDDNVIAGAMEKHIAAWGFQVRRVQDFSKVLLEFANFDPQLVLLENKGKIVTRDALMLRLWESDSFVDENTLSISPVCCTG